jgi:hypothetical protein
MKKAFIVIAATALSIASVGAIVANALPNTATTPLIMDSSGYAVFGSTTTTAATNCTGEDAQTYSSTHATSAQFGTLTDGNQLTANVTALGFPPGTNRPNDVEPSNANPPGLNMTTTSTSGPGSPGVPGFQIKADFTFSNATGRGTGQGTVTIYPAATGKTGTHPKYKASGKAYFVLQVTSHVGTNVTFVGRAFFNATIYRWNTALTPDAYSSTKHTTLVNSEFKGQTSTAIGGATSVYSGWGSTFDSGAVLAQATAPAPEFLSPLPVDDLSVLTDVPTKTCP